MIDWHHLFGLTLTDYFTNSNFSVELEKDLSLQQQYLDVLIIKKSDDKFLVQLPDGLDNLSQYNLLTYKSLWEPLDNWAIGELNCSYVIYRKQVSPSLKKLLPEEDFRLYAVSTRYPQKLAQKVPLKEIVQGIYDVLWGTDVIRLIVTSQVEKHERNALWHLYSGNSEGFAYGENHYHWQNPKGRALLNQLYELYQLEGVVMSYTWEDFDRDYTREHLNLLTPEERLEGLSSTERLKGLPPEERLKGLPPEVIEEYLAKLKQHA